MGQSRRVRAALGLRLPTFCEPSGVGLHRRHARDKAIDLHCQFGLALLAQLLSRGAPIMEYSLSRALHRLETLIDDVLLGAEETKHFFDLGLHEGGSLWRLMLAFLSRW